MAILDRSRSSAILHVSKQSDNRSQAASPRIVPATCEPLRLAHDRHGPFVEQCTYDHCRSTTFYKTPLKDQDTYTPKHTSTSQHRARLSASTHKHHTTTLRSIYYPTILTTPLRATSCLQPIAVTRNRKILWSKMWSHLQSHPRQPSA